MNVKKMRKALTLLCCLMLLFQASVACADSSFSMADDGFSTSYSYTYDFWEDVLMCPNPYRISNVIDSMTLGLDNLGGVRLKNPQGMFVRNNDLYIADTTNNRIIQVRKDKDGYSVTRIIDTIAGTDVTSISSPYDVFVDEQDNIYIADYGNQRVVMVDKDLNFIRQFTKPSDATYDQNLDFLPKKIAVDVAGRLYALVVNVNKGFCKYEADGTFTGYVGANQVTVDTFDYIWKRYFMTQEQRSASEAFVPTEYENLYMDNQGFIYATTTVFSEYDLKWDNAKPIRRLNGLGNDILIKNDRYPPIGDLWWVSESTPYGPSKFTDVTVLDDDVYVCLDRIRGRLFGYDGQGVLLWAFGTKGNIEGAFTSAIALEHMGTDLLVMDQLENSITVFETTEYGQLIFDANSTYLHGEYDRSAELWNDVMKLNANYPMAFRGIGRALMRQDKYEEAMDYFEKAHDKENYGRAFKFYRKRWVEQNIWWIVLIIALLLIVPLAIGRVKRTKWEVIMHEQQKVHRTE